MTTRFESADGKPLKLYPTPDRPIPAFILLAAGALALSAVSLGFLSERTGVGAFATPRIETLAERGLVLVDDGGAMVSVEDAESGEALLTVPTEAGGFAVEALRNLERYRLRQGLDAAAAPYLLSLKTDGRLVVEDPLTRSMVELRAFGEKNARVFAAMLDIDRKGAAQFASGGADAAPPALAGGTGERRAANGRTE